MVKNLPAMRKTWIWSLGQEDPLDKGMATHSSILSWRIPWTEKPGGLQSMGSQRVRHDWVTNTCIPNTLNAPLIHFCIPGFLFHLVAHNLLLSLFRCSTCPRFVQWEHFWTGIQALLKWPHEFTPTSWIPVQHHGVDFWVSPCTCLSLPPRTAGSLSPGVCCVFRYLPPPPPHFFFFKTHSLI